VSDLADLAADLTKDLPLTARKVIDAALANGWELNPPGMTVALRLNHPTDSLAQPVYITWHVGRTPKGAMSFKFSSCGTQGLVRLTGADLLQYLEDPTVIYPTDEEAAEAEADYDATQWEKGTPKWDDKASPIQNVVNQMHGQVIAVESTTAADLMREQKVRLLTPEVSSPPDTPMSTSATSPRDSASSVRPLRIQAPKA
jgi:hypothetical protein